MTEFNFDYKSIKENTITGRYITNTHIFKFLKNKTKEFNTEIIGASVLDREIKMISLGSGSIKIFMWSQMHGNESTTTKAIIDLINFLNSKSELSKLIKENCTLKIIPILNPDGAAAYTRVNANGVDLNRDAYNLSQPESVVLQNIYKRFQPDFCFNLHDQRTIFNVGNSSKPATIAFLAPPHDKEHSISKTRAISMQLISAMNIELKQRIPGQISRFDDVFNSNCTGDTFQILNTPTILFEAGHYHNDYQREKTREYMFYAILRGLTVVADNTVNDYSKNDYFSIPENNKLFFDILIRNVYILNSKYKKEDTIGILFKEILQNDTILFKPKIEKYGNLESFFGHIIYDCNCPKDLCDLKSKNSVIKLLS